MPYTFERCHPEVKRTPVITSTLPARTGPDEARVVSVRVAPVAWGSPHSRRFLRRLVAPRQRSVGVIGVIARLQKSLELSLRTLDARQLSREPDPPRPIAPRTQDLCVCASLSVNLLALNQKPLLELACCARNPFFQQPFRVGSHLALPSNKVEQCRGFGGKECGPPLLIRGAHRQKLRPQPAVHEGNLS